MPKISKAILLLKSKKRARKTANRKAKIKRSIYVRAYMHIMTKVISLSDEAYNDLKSLKANDKSFSDVVREFASNSKKEKMLELVGAWKDAPEMDMIFKKIFEKRHKKSEMRVKF